MPLSSLILAIVAIAATIAFIWIINKK